MSLPANAIRGDRVYVADVPDLPLRVIAVKDGELLYVDVPDLRALDLAADLMAAARRRLAKGESR